MEINLIDSLNWRYACKAMNGQKAPDEKICRIVEAARLAPSANGLQPVEIFVVENQEIKNKIGDAARNQAQVATCSHLLVFTAWENFTAEKIQATFDAMKKNCGRETADDYKQYVIQNYTTAPAALQAVMAANQAFIAFGIAITTAAVERLDACPMTGFSSEKVDEILGLKAKGLRSVALLPVGYRDSAKDWNENLPKARKTMDEFLTEIK